MNLGASGPRDAGRRCSVVTGNFFDVLGVRAQVGRTFSSAEAAPERDPRLVVVTVGVLEELVAGRSGGDRRVARPGRRTVHGRGRASRRLPRGVRLDRAADLRAGQPADADGARRPRHSQPQRAGAAEAGRHAIAGTGSRLTHSLRHSSARIRTACPPKGRPVSRVRCPGHAVPRRGAGISRLQDVVVGDRRSRASHRVRQCRGTADGSRDRTAARDCGSRGDWRRTRARRAGDARRKSAARGDWIGGRPVDGVRREPDSVFLGDGAAAERHGPRQSHSSVCLSVRAPDDLVCGLLPALRATRRSMVDDVRQAARA